MRVSSSPFFTAALFPRFANMSASYALSNKNVQEFINRTDLHFDLIVNEEIYHDVFLMFGWKYNAPVVTICEFSPISLMRLHIQLSIRIFQHKST